MYTAPIVSVLLALGSALAFPTDLDTNVKRQSSIPGTAPPKPSCGSNAWCNSCFQNGCGSNSVIIAASSAFVDVGNIYFETIAGTLFQACNTPTSGTTACVGTFPLNTVLANGAPGLVTVTYQGSAANSTMTQLYGAFVNVLHSLGQTTTGQGSGSSGISGSSQQAGITHASIPWKVQFQLNTGQLVEASWNVTNLAAAGNLCSTILALGGAADSAISTAVTNPITGFAAAGFTLAALMCN